MSELRASKFNPITDIDRPVIGEKIDGESGIIVVCKVDWLPLQHFITGGPEPDVGKYDEVLLRNHATRPAVYWVIWGRKVDTVTEVLHVN